MKCKHEVYRLTKTWTGGSNPTTKVTHVECDYCGKNLPHVKRYLNNIRGKRPQMPAPFLVIK